MSTNHFIGDLGGHHQYRTRMHYKESELGEGGMAIEVIEDLGKVAKFAEEQRHIQEARGLSALNRTLYPIAEVPMTVAVRAMQEQWDDKDWRRWVDDPDNAAFRIAPRNKRIIRV